MQSSIAMAIHMPRRPSGGDEKHRETEADDPDAAKVQKAWHKRIACSAEGSGGNDGSAEKRLGEQFDAEYLGGKRANLRVRSQNAKDERTEDHHQTSSDGHQDCAHGNADISVAFRQLVISGAVASADERCRGGTDAVAWHVAEPSAVTANELAAIAMEPSGAISMVAATMALFIAISCTATGKPILNAVFRIFASKTVFSFRRRRSRGLRTQQNQAPVRLMTAQASIVPIPAPMTPKPESKEH